MAKKKYPEPLRELAETLPLTLSRTQAAELLHMSPTPFDRAVHSGELRAIKSAPGKSGRIFVTRAELLRWMAERLTA